MAPRKRKTKRKQKAAMTHSADAVENKNRPTARVLPPAPEKPQPSVDTATASKTKDSTQTKDSKRIDDLTAKVYAVLDQVADQYVAGPAAILKEEVQKAAEAALQAAGIEKVTADALKDRALVLKDQASKAVSETLASVVKAVDENTPTALKSEAKSFATKAHKAVEQNVGPENIQALKAKATELTDKASKAMNSGMDQASKAMSTGLVSVQNASVVDNVCEMKDTAINSVEKAGAECLYWIVLAGVWFYMQLENLQHVFLNQFTLAQNNVLEAGSNVSKMMPDAVSEAEKTFQLISNLLPALSLLTAFTEASDTEKPGTVKKFVSDVAKYIQNMATGIPNEHQAETSDSKCGSTGDSDS